MVSERQIEDAVAVLVREARPESVILFGSYARGTAGPESDVDLLVIEAQPVNVLAEMARLRKALSALRIPVDVVVAGADHVRSSWAGFPGSYLYDALREGKVLYALDGAGADAP